MIEIKKMIGHLNKINLNNYTNHYSVVKLKTK